MPPTNTRQLPCSTTKAWQKTCSGKKESCHLLTSKARAVVIYLQKHMATTSFGCGLGDGRVGEVINAHTPAPSACVKLVCGRIAKRPHTSPPYGEKRTCGRPDECPHTSLVLRGTQKLLERAKIRAELVGRGSMRVGELPDAHTCGR